MELKPLGAGVGKTPSVKPGRFSDLIAKEVERIPAWIEPGIVTKHGITLLGGEAKIGKSLILGSLARALAVGEDPFLAPGLSVPQKARVLVVDQEVGEFGLQKRCTPMLADLDFHRYEDRLWYVTKDVNLMLDSSAGVAALTRHIEEVQPNVVILDPIGKMFTFDENNNVEVAKLGHALEKLIAKFHHLGLSFILSHHFGKPPKGQSKEDHDPLESYNFRGASKWKDFPDTLITVSRGDRMATPHQAWRIDMRILPRHAEEPPDMHLTVNEKQDFRVRYARTDKRFVPRLDKADVERPPVTGEQKAFVLV